MSLHAYCLVFPAQSFTSFLFPGFACCLSDSVVEKPGQGAKLSRSITSWKTPLRGIPSPSKGIVFLTSFTESQKRIKVLDPVVWYRVHHKVLEAQKWRLPLEK